MNSVFENHMINDKLVPVICHTDAISAEEFFTVNWHDNIELLCGVSGSGKVYDGASNIDIARDEICVINSYDLHGVRSDNRITYHCLIIDNSFCAANGIDASMLRFKKKITDPEVVRAYKKVVDIFNNPKDSFTYPAVIRAAVLELLVLLGDRYIDYDDMVESQKDTTQRVKAVILYVKQHYAEKITLDEIAEYVGISKYHLTREFKHYTKATIFEYINTIRCKEAKRLMAGGMLVSEAALSCGFENFSYFSKTYKHYMGELPSLAVKTDIGV